MKRTTWHISEMDCPSEERMIRMRLEGIAGIAKLEFDLNGRQLDILHDADLPTLEAALAGLELGARRIAHADETAAVSTLDDAGNRGPLIWALAINATLFVCEFTAGMLARSMGLVADSLDMLADASVYALSLVAVGRSASRKRGLAATSGYLQLLLAVTGLLEVVRRTFWPTEAPEAGAMIAMSALALAGNIATLLVLRRTTGGEAHIEASRIFTSNDVKVNLLVIVAGLLVWWSASHIPDLLVGAVVFVIVANGARRILALSRG